MAPRQAAAWLVLLAMVVPVSSVRSRLVLNEVLYDPPGSDTGREFVELFLAGTDSLSLDGVRLVFVNGAAPDTRKTIWRAPEGLLLAPGTFFVVGESGVEPRDAQATLSLQNGPDAVWLLRGEEVLDRLAWGDMEGLGEGTPAEDVSGTSLGRVPDGADSDDNATDWRRLDRPNPARVNAAAVDFGLGPLEADPPHRSTQGVVRFMVIARAHGWASHQEGTVRWSLDGDLLAETPLSLSANDSIGLEREFPLPWGRHRVRVEIVTPSAVVDSERLIFQVGVGDVVLNELMVRPLDDQPEWIELHVPGAAPPVLQGWAISDATRKWRTLPEIVIPPGGFALLCGDPERLRGLFDLPEDVSVVTPQGGWPSLNNTQGSGAEFADEVLLRDELGAVVDYLAYTSDLILEEGHSIERGLIANDSPRAWFAASGPPSPGRPNPSAQAVPPVSGLRVQPNPFTPDGDGEGDVLHILLRHPLDGLAVVAEVFDLEGGRVCTLGTDSAGGGLRQWLWDGRDARGRPVPMGAYVVVVRGGGHGTGERRWSALVALARR